MEDGEKGSSLVLFVRLGMVLLSLALVGKRGLRGEPRIFLGEYSSFHALTISWLQNASMLGRCGVGGIRVFKDLLGEVSLDFDGLSGGVVGRLVVESGGFFRGERERGDELKKVSDIK